jgi:hypothetical protein
VNGEPSDALRESAVLDDLEAEVDLVDAAMTHVAEGNLDAADAALNGLSGSADSDADGQSESSESIPDQPFRPAS